MKAISPSIAASLITCETLVSNETMGQIQERILDGNRGMQEELPGILRQRLEIEGEMGLYTFQDWMNPGKIGSRLTFHLIKQGISYNEAKAKIVKLIKDYELKYNDVIYNYRTYRLCDKPKSIKIIGVLHPQGGRWSTRYLSLLPSL